MAKPKKNIPKKENSKSSSIHCLGTLIIVFLIYSYSLFRGWLPFDERVIYSETLFPIPTSFNEIFEVIRSFVINSHIESMNSFFSNHITIRSAPMAWMIMMFMFYFFQKNAFLYHLFQLVIHLVNTALVWFIFKAASQKLLSNSGKFYFTISLFTLLWSLHSTNTEAVLLATNWNTILTDGFALGFILYEIRKIEKGDFHNSRIETLFISILYLFSLSLTEINYTLPVIICFLTFVFSFLKGQTQDLFSYALRRSLPYFMGLVIFAALSHLKPLASHSSQLYSFLERNLWLTPQIFIHFLKLFFFPLTLSTYQSNLIHLANTLYEPYTIFCTSIYLIFLVTPLVFFLAFKKGALSYIFLLVYPFYFSLVPFLQILTPTYCLSADRYCYFPLLLLLLFVFCLLLQFKYLNSKTTTIVISVLLLLLSARTVTRIYEWEKPSLFFESAIKVEKNPLYKAQKLIILADYNESVGNEPLKKESLQKALNNLTNALKEFKKLKKLHINEPITLKLYGLDLNSLILKTTYLISYIKSKNFLENPHLTLAFFEPYIKRAIKYANINEITFYADLLSKNNELKKAKEILEYTLKRFPYSQDLLFSLSNYYLDIERDPDKAYKILDLAYKYYPNQSRILFNLLKYYEAKNDLPKQAYYAYLLGLRDHSIPSYQRAVQIYLDLNYLKEANVILKKLVRLKGNDPTTLLFMSRYLDLKGNRKKIPEILNTAYLLCKAQGKDQDIKVTKSILISLIKLNIHLNNLNNAKAFLSEFEKIKNLNQEDMKQLKELKLILRK